MFEQVARGTGKFQRQFERMMTSILNGQSILFVCCDDKSKASSMEKFKKLIPAEINFTENEDTLFFGGVGKITFKVMPYNGRT